MAPGMLPLSHPGRRERATAMRSNLHSTEEYIAPGPMRSALPRIYVVGNMRALAPGGTDFLPRGRKTRGLLAYLCLAQGERVTRSRPVGLSGDRCGVAQARR